MSRPGTGHHPRAAGGRAAVAVRRGCGRLGALALALALGLPADAACARAQETPRKTVVGVLPFQVPPGHEALSVLAASQVREDLAESPRYELVEEQRIATVMAEIARSYSRDYSQREAINVGQLIAARYIVFGEVLLVQLNPPGSAFDCDLSVALRLVKVETGAIVFQKVTTVHGARPASCLSRAITELTCELLKASSLAGIVVEVKERGEVLVDLGSRDGVRRGQRLAVLREAGVLVHPATGKELRRPDEDCGEIELETVGEETSMAKPVKPGDSDIRVGDRVLLPIVTNCSRLGSVVSQAGTPLLKALLKGIK
jgi:hypothetical protein